MNNQRVFDILQKEKLGKYVYVLRDPRDGKIFYVGQGINDRVFEHFNEADNCANSSIPFNQMSSKVIRILDIWKNNEDVEWIILAHDLPSNNLADYIESAIFDSLSESQNGETLNEISPPKSSRLLPDDLEAMAAEFVNPTSPTDNVFVFPIQNVLSKGVSPYNATRTTWAVSNNYRLWKPAYAVGLKNSISKGSFEISSWTSVTGTINKYEFTSPNHPNPTDYQPLLNKNWNNVLAVAKGFWQRGNYLIVHFNGNGKFKIIRGSQDTNSWHNCV